MTLDNYPCPLPPCTEQGEAQDAAAALLADVEGLAAIAAGDYTAARVHFADSLWHSTRVQFSRAWRAFAARGA